MQTTADLVSAIAFVIGALFMLILWAVGRHSARAEMARRLCENRLKSSLSAHSAAASVIQGLVDARILSSHKYLDAKEVAVGKLTASFEELILEAPSRADASLAFGSSDTSLWPETAGQRTR